MPLTAKQKFALALRTSVDPFSFGLIGAIAGIQQAQNAFSGYGQGAQGYAKRYGASYADFVSGTFIGSAILPSLLKQDPRYFYKGNGGIRSANPSCARQFRGMQGRQQETAAELFEHCGKSCRRRHFEPLLPR